LPAKPFCGPAKEGYLAGRTCKGQVLQTRMTWSDHLLSYYRSLKPPALPEGIGWLYPQQQPEVMTVLEAFCRKFFNDSGERRLLLGINPGRLGAGVTGVNFTAPRQLTQHCGIAHPFGEGTELSAEFIYDLILAYGGPQAFYRRYFIGSVCPLGFVRGGKNLNYYDDRDLLRTVEPFILKSMEKLLSFSVARDRCLCIGGEKNYRYLHALNQRFGWFGEIAPVAHPRFIMQYRRSQKEQFIRQYLQLMEN
jgi:hypothetical protein